MSTDRTATAVIKTILTLYKGIMHKPLNIITFSMFQINPNPNSEDCSHLPLIQNQTFNPKSTNNATNLSYTIGDRTEAS